MAKAETAKKWKSFILSNKNDICLLAQDSIDDVFK